MTTALVLGGGGITGIAWEVGIVYGLRAAGVDLTGADTVVGTSAGSIVGTMVACGVDPDVALDMQRNPPPAEPLDVDLALVMKTFAILRDPGPAGTAARAQVGALALAAPVAATGDEDRQVKLFAAQMPQEEWPARRLLVTGVDAETGEAVAWTRESGVPLVRAVAASCAVPCVYPPVRINGRRYIDGGLHSGTNADLAGDASRIVVVAPLADLPPLGAPPAELAALRERAEVALIKPDSAAKRAIGPNVLDSSRRAAALEAGLAQAETLAREGAVQGF